MYKQVNELISLLEAEGKSEVKLINRERHIYQIDSKHELAWNKHSNRFGQLHAGEKSLYLELDFPVQAFSAEDLKEATGLPLQEETGAAESYVSPTFSEGSYDSVQIVISQDDLETYSFTDERFVSWLNKLIDTNVK